MWKAFHYSPKKAENLTEIQTLFNEPELKLLKPSDTRWLAREMCVWSVRRSLPALVRTFEEIYDEKGDADAYGLAKLLCKYKFVTCLYMLCDVLHTIAKLQGNLKAKSLDLAGVPTMVSSTIERLRELKECPSSSTWFKDHTAVFSNPKQLGDKQIIVAESDQAYFLQNIYCPYIQGVINHVSSRLKSSDVFSSFSVFDPSHVPNDEVDISLYGTDKLQTLINFYGTEQRVTCLGKTGVSVPDVDGEQVEAEWKIFHRVMFAQFKSGGTDSDGSALGLELF